MNSHQNKTLSLLYIVTVIWAVCTIWIAPHPPMVDLPQHAGQVTLLRDILLGQSRWNTLFDVNFFTPYFTSYGLSAVLAAFMSVATAFKLILSISYIAFIYMCIQLRKHFGVDSRLDWLFILPFFGIAYKWGFLSFVTSAPLGLWFILEADRFAKNQSLLRGIGLAAIGLAVLESHGLMFLFVSVIGTGLMLIRTQNLRALITGSIPYWVLLAAFGIIFMINLNINTKLGLTEFTTTQNTKPWHLELYRFPEVLYYSLVRDRASLIPIFHKPVTLILFLAPWLLGLRINLRNKAAGLFFVILSLVLIFMPMDIMGTTFVYQRFAFLLIPSYVLLFTNKSPHKQSFLHSNQSQHIILALITITTWSVLAFNTHAAWSFKNESADFDKMLSALAPNQKALSLVFDITSKADNNNDTYAHYPLWYQAEKHGLVDFNFAYFPAMAVRIKPSNQIAYPVSLQWSPETFDWNKNKGEDYRYFFVRSATVSPQVLFKGARCMPVILSQKDSWTIYENKPCSAN